MLLYVMRHGPAEDRAATGRDADRALTEEGRGVVRRAARELWKARAGGDPGGSGGQLRVLSSPFRRAHETAEAVVREHAVHEADPVEVELHDDLAADAGLPLRLVDTLAQAGADALLVGHQPAVEELARALLHPERPPLPGGFRTATILAIERVDLAAHTARSSPRWRPAWVVDPHRLPTG